MPLSTNRGWPTSWWRTRRWTSTPSRPATQISDVCFDSSLWPAIALRSGQRHSNWPFSSAPTLTMSNCTGTCKGHSFHRQKQTSRYSLFATHQVEKCNLTLHETLHSMLNAKLQGQGLNTAIKAGSSRQFKRYIPHNLCEFQASFPLRIRANQSSSYSSIDLKLTWLWEYQWNRLDDPAGPCFHGSVFNLC